jgi:demethylmenaquinone methyltransferase/2-methoxy-6-polyprenyl-1,4-benzoquinol methylase
MFARIVGRYDLMNRLMTFGLDGPWRRAAAALAQPAGGRALDVGTGTGDLALALVESGARQVVGVDFVTDMLTSARAKITRAGRQDRATVLQADALHLPFADDSFDCVVNGFLLRNVGDLPAALAEMARVLRPGGRLVCLEITHPPTLIAPLFHVYFDRLVPLVGALITGEGAAYRYLPASLGPLPGPRRLAALIEQAGFVEVRYRRVGFGSVAVHVGRKGSRAQAGG